MPKQLKYDKILDALQKLLETKELSNISVSEIAQTAEIGKGSIYYYFSSKDAILEALVERNYEAPITTARHLAEQREISPFTRMALILPKFLCGFFKDPAINYKGCTGAGFSSSKVHESSHRFTQAGSCFHY